MTNTIKDIYAVDIYRKKIDLIDADTTVEEALELFEKKHTNGFIVVNRKKEPIGIFTLDEINMAILPHEFKDNINMSKAMYTRGFFVSICNSVKHKKISEIMRKDLVTVDLQANILSIIAIFVLTKLPFIPVVEGKKIVGTISKILVKKAIQQAFYLNN